MPQRVIFVTGASSGIGAATARQFAAQGDVVYAAARRLDRLEAMRAPNVIPLALDVTSDESVREAVASIMRQHGRIDVLVNNAGYALYGGVEEVDLADAEYQLAVNVIGLARVLQAVLPVMRGQRSGTIVNLSSVAGKVSTPFAGWYSASKHAVEALSDALRVEVRRLGINVVLIQPGAIRTEFGDIALNGLEKAASVADYRPMATAFDRLIRQSYRNAPGPEVVAARIVGAVNARQPRTRYAFPNDSRMFIFMRWLLRDRTFDRLLMSQIR